MSHSLTRPRYLLRIVDEPHEEPIALNQAAFDLIVARGMSLPDPADASPQEAPGVEHADEDNATSGEDSSENSTLVDFATVETLTDKPFLFRDEPIDADLVAAAFSRGLLSILRDALDRVEAEGHLVPPTDDRSDSAPATDTDTPGAS